MLKKTVPQHGLCVVFFFHSHCISCSLDEGRFKDIVSQCEGKVCYISIDILQHPGGERRKMVTIPERDYKITTLPTLLIFRDGKEKRRIGGHVSSQALGQALDSIVSDSTE